MRLNEHVHVLSYPMSEEVGVNTFLVKGEDSAYLIDSGVKQMTADIDALVCEADAKPSLRALINTHAHADHIGANGYVVDTYKIPVIAPRGAKPWIENFSTHYSEFCLLYPDIFPDEPSLRNEIFPLMDHETKVSLEITEGCVFDLGGAVLDTFTFPGHMSYEVGFFERKTKTLILGDAITGYNWSFIHGHVTRAGYLQTLFKLESIIKERDVQQVVTGHFAATDALGALQHIASARDYIYTLDETIDGILKGGGPQTLAQVWKMVCDTLHKREEFRGLTTVDAHLREGVTDGRFELQNGLYKLWDGGKK